MDDQKAVIRVVLSGVLQCHRKDLILCLKEAVCENFQLHSLQNMALAGCSRHAWKVSSITYSQRFTHYTRTMCLLMRPPLGRNSSASPSINDLWTTLGVLLLFFIEQEVLCPVCVLMCMHMHVYAANKKSALCECHEHACVCVCCSQ